MWKKKPYNVIPFSDFSQLFFVSLIGANRKIEDLIKKYFEKIGRYTDGNEFYYYEYLLTKPYEKNKKNLDCYWFFAPFLPRLSKKTNVMYDLTKMENKIAKKNELLINNHIANVKEGLWINKIIEFWESDTFKKWDEKSSQNNGKTFSDNSGEYKIEINLNDENEEQSELQKHPPLTPRKYYYSEGRYFFAVVPNYCIKWAKEMYEVKKNDITNLNEKDWKKQVSLISRNIEHAYRLGYLHDLKKEVKVPTLAIPLATESFFYGELIISFPDLDSEESERHLCKLAEDIYPTILEYYLPAVIITHEHFYEDNEIYNKKAFLIPEWFKTKVNNFEEHNSSLDYRVPWDNTNNFNQIQSSSNARKIEYYLNKLWQRIHSDKTLKGESIKKHLVLRKYLITSPFMLDLFLQLLDTASNLQHPRKVNSNLPSILVVGKPGSGKDTIPNLIKTFSLNKNGFFGATIYKINMAAIKPDAIVGPLLSGVKLGANRILKLDFTGILGEVAKKSRINPIVLVLDELNSMHVDLQGILLRFLENSEVIPLGQIEDNNDRPIKCLVIGIMNEDPDEISREKAMHFVENEKYLGGIAKDVLYEQFIKLRRLRPDLKYRLIRGGSFYLKNLENRRDDIPILFYIFIREELKADLVKKDYKIILEIDLLEELLSEHISWTGNVRQLQSLSKKVVSLVKNNCIENTKTIPIYRENLIQAMKLI